MLHLFYDFSRIRRFREQKWQLSNFVLAGARGEGQEESLKVTEARGKTCDRDDNGTIDRVQNVAEGAVVRGPSATGIQCLVFLNG